jgi:hypothetical protein
MNALDEAAEVHVSRPPSSIPDGCVAQYIVEDYVGPLAAVNTTWQYAPYDSSKGVWWFRLPLGTMHVRVRLVLGVEAVGRAESLDVIVARGKHPMMMRSLVLGVILMHRCEVLLCVVARCVTTAAPPAPSLVAGGDANLQCLPTTGTLEIVPGRTERELVLQVAPDPGAVYEYRTTKGRVSSAWKKALYRAERGQWYLYPSTTPGPLEVEVRCVSSDGRPSPVHKSPVVVGTHS